jgi:hypothetical protein
MGSVSDCETLTNMRWSLQLVDHPRLQKAQAAEYAARWESEYERIEAKRDEWARKYAEYPKIVTQLVDLFGSAKAVDEENGSAPPGEHRRLLGVELTAAVDPPRVGHPPIDDELTELTRRDADRRCCFRLTKAEHNRHGIQYVSTRGHCVVPAGGTRRSLRGSSNFDGDIPRYAAASTRERPRLATAS